MVFICSYDYSFLSISFFKNFHNAKKNKNLEENINLQLHFFEEMKEINYFFILTTCCNQNGKWKY